MKLRNVKFEVGSIVVTPAAEVALSANGTLVDDLLARHQEGDWGDVTDPLRMVNERGLTDCFNLQSRYTLADGQRLVVLTNRDRTTTMVHLDAQVSAAR